MKKPSGWKLEGYESTEGLSEQENDKRSKIIRDLVNEEIMRIIKSLVGSIEAIDGNYHDVIFAICLTTDILPQAGMKLMASTGNMHDGIFDAFEAMANNWLTNTIPELRKQLAEKADEKSEEVSRAAKATADELRAGLDIIIRKLEARSGKA